MDECMLSTVVTDALVLAISIHSAEYIFNVLDQIHRKHETLSECKPLLHLKKFEEHEIV